MLPLQKQIGLLRHGDGRRNSKKTCKLRSARSLPGKQQNGHVSQPGVRVGDKAGELCDGVKQKGEETGSESDQSCPPRRVSGRKQWTHRGEGMKHFRKGSRKSGYVCEVSRLTASQEDGREGQPWTCTGDFSSPEIKEQPMSSQRRHLAAGRRRRDAVTPSTF